MRAEDIMTTDLITTVPEASVLEATRLVVQHRVAALPVLDGKGELVGIVSELDLLRHRVQADPTAHLLPVPAATGPVPRTVADVMTAAVHAVPLRTDAAGVAEVLARTGVRSLPVVRGPHVVGMIGRRDLLRLLDRADAEIASDVDRALGEQRDFIGVWGVEVLDGEVQLSGGPPQQAAVAVTVARTVRGVVRVSATPPDAPLVGRGGRA